MAGLPTAGLAGDSTRERDALLRLASLVTAGAGPDDVFGAVASEASALNGGSDTVLVRFTGEREASVVGSSAGRPVIGTSLAVGPDGGAWPFDDAIGVRISIGGAPWGALIVAGSGAAAGGAAAHRLAQFGLLVAGAIAQVAARSELELLADERATLRRIHAVAGRGGTGDDVLAAIAAEGSRWMGGGPSLLVRLGGQGTARVVASSDPGLLGGAAGRQVDDALVAEVARSGMSHRWADGPVGSRRQLFGERDVRAAIGVPVAIDGRLWGVFVAGSTTGPMDPDAETRLVHFVASITPTIASALARTQLAAEQSALRRVAELVARGAQSAEVFDAVVLEASVLVHDATVTLVRWDSPGHVRIIGAHGADAPEVGGQVAIDRQVIADLLAGENLSAGAGSPAGSTLADRLGYHGAVVVPVELAGSLWGMLGAGSASGPLPAPTEDRLHQFADLVAAALANAEARSEIQSLAQRQSGLRRVAERAARAEPVERVLDAVVVEAAALAGVEFTGLLRYGPDGSTETVAAQGVHHGFAVGDRAAGDGDGAAQQVWRTGRAARVEGPAATSGRWSPPTDGSARSASVAVPIPVHDSLWGVLVAVGRLDEEVPASMEEQLRSFAELASVTISADRARQELRTLADEQSALGRVADLVVRGATLDEVFVAIAAEASKLLGGMPCGLWRMEADGTFLLLANTNCAMTVGFLAPAYPDTPFYDLTRTGRPARVADFEGTPLADVTRQLKIGPTTAVPVTVEERLWGAVTISTWNEPLPADVERRLQQFGEIAAAAIANAENKAKLITSRARVVATADETRRRLQRDVHDSAQQRLVHTIIALKLARQAISAGAPPDALVEEALLNAERANSELRDVVRGILPAALTRGGLRAGLESLVSDLVLPVELQVTGARCPAPTELTAYFVVAEALTNVVKHAQAGHASVTVGIDGEVLVVEIRDDGIGGADPTRGSGLVGLLDHVDAAEGSLDLTSPAGAGTRLIVRLPIR